MWFDHAHNYNSFSLGCLEPSFIVSQSTQWIPALSCIWHKRLSLSLFWNVTLKINLPLLMALQTISRPGLSLGVSGSQCKWEESHFQLNKVLWNLSMEDTRIPQNIQMSVNFWFVCVEHHKPTRLLGGGDNGVQWSLPGPPIPMGAAHRPIASVFTGGLGSGPCDAFTGWLGRVHVL
jgi:hypothetical protein